MSQRPRCRAVLPRAAVGDWPESYAGVKILLLDEAGSNQKLRYVDESDNTFSSWLVAQRKARSRKLFHTLKLDPRPLN
jgi:hypothetical protein